MPFRVVLDAFLYLLEIVELFANLLEFLLVVLGNHPDLQALLKGLLEKVDNLVPGDRVQVSFKAFTFFSSEKEGLIADFLANKVKIILETVVRFKHLGLH
jgi:hypothetical protein